MFFLLATCTFAWAQEKDWGVITVSACNTRSAADYNASQESQGLLGMPVKVLDEKNEWTKIETPEGYQHWTLSAAVERMTRQKLSEWNRSPQVVVTALTGTVYEQPSVRSQPMSDVVGGNRLRLTECKGRFYAVEFPDGRKGYLPKSEGEPLDWWRTHLDNCAENILHTARRFMGVPYLWSGTSPKGVDCSGFVRSVLYMHDIIIPRNASQMARIGQRLEIGDFSALLPGDLLLFGRPAKDGRPERVFHVAFYLGGKRFIHSLGRVRVASFDPQDELYDEYDHNRLLFAVRFLPLINKEAGLFTTDNSDFYK